MARASGWRRTALGSALAGLVIVGALANRAMAPAYAAGGEVAKAHPRSAWRGPEAAFAWLAPERARRNSADPRAVQRLGAERANLAEAALMLLELWQRLPLPWATTD